MYLSDSEQNLTREEMASFNAFFDNLLPPSFQYFIWKTMVGTLSIMKTVIFLYLVDLTPLSTANYL